MGKYKIDVWVPSYKRKQGSRTIRVKGHDRHVTKGRGRRGRGR